MKNKNHQKKEDQEDQEKLRKQKTNQEKEDQEDQEKPRKQKTNQKKEDQEDQEKLKKQKTNQKTNQKKKKPNNQIHYLKLWIISKMTKTQTLITPQITN